MYICTSNLYEQMMLGIVLLLAYTLSVLGELEHSCHSLCLCDDSEMKLTCRDITLTAEHLRTFVLPPGVEEVSLLNNNISLISAEVLRPFRGVIKLEISSNLLANVSSNTFQEFQNLTTLILNNNRIKELHRSSFTGLTNLLKLELAGNRLVRLHKEMFNELSSIRSIKLQKNKIEAIPNKVFTPLRTLRDLFMGNNEISVLGDAAFQNLNMNKVELTNNKIKKISRSTFLNYQSKFKIMFFNNELDCGCHQAMTYAKYFRDMRNYVWASCTTPPELKGKSILTAYVGTQCTLCDLNLCKNGAGCQGNKTYFSCMCPEQFKGEFCERNICKPEIKYVDRYVKLPSTTVLKNFSHKTENSEKQTKGQGTGSSKLELENRELETKLMILYAVCSVELVIILCFVGLLILSKYQDWRLMKRYNMDKQPKSPHILEKFQWTPASEIDNLNGNGKGYISISELVPYKF